MMNFFTFQTRTNPCIFNVVEMKELVDCSAMKEHAKIARMRVDLHVHLWISIDANRSAAATRKLYIDFIYHMYGIIVKATLFGCIQRCMERYLFILRISGLIKIKVTLSFAHSCNKNSRIRWYAAPLLASTTRMLRVCWEGSSWVNVEFSNERAKNRREINGSLIYNSTKCRGAWNQSNARNCPHTNWPVR